MAPLRWWVSKLIISHVLKRSEPTNFWSLTRATRGNKALNPVEQVMHVTA